MITRISDSRTHTERYTHKKILYLFHILFCYHKCQLFTFWIAIYKGYGHFSLDIQS